MRMGVLLGENVGFLIGEAEESDPIWLRKQRILHAWVTGTPNIDGATAVTIRDEWRKQYLVDRAQQSNASFRRNNRLNWRKSDWDKLYQHRAKKVAKSGNPKLFQ